MAPELVCCGPHLVFKAEVGTVIMLGGHVVSPYCLAVQPLYITGNKKQSEERAALFAVRVYVIVMFFCLPINGGIEFLNAHRAFINSWNRLYR